MAHCVNIVFHVTFSIIRQHYASQLAISSKVEASISGEDQQTSHISPADLMLINNDKETIKIFRKTYSNNKVGYLSCLK